MSEEMKKFVELMDEVFAVSKNIPGISNIDWDIKYKGTSESVNEIVYQINKIMYKHGMI